METKVSIRFFDDREVRAAWDGTENRWMFSVLDIVAVLTNQDDYEKTRNYWKYLKAKLKKVDNELGSVTTQMKLLAPDGRRRLTNVMNYDQIISLAKEFPSKQARLSFTVGYKPQIREVTSLMDASLWCSNYPSFTP